MSCNGQTNSVETFPYLVNETLKVSSNKFYGKGTGK